MNRFILIFTLLTFFSCSSSDPKEMAKEYCECVKINLEKADFQNCIEMAKEHKSILEGDQDKLQKYSDELVNCTNVSR